MIRNSVALSACLAVVLVSSFSCAAQTFGTLDASRQTGHVAGDILNDPRFTKWLMTLPRSDGTIQTVEAESDRPELFGEDPIGGQIYHFVALPQSGARDLMADDRMFHDALDPHPIGGRTFVLVKFAGPLRAIALNAAPSVRPALEGRSVSTKKRTIAKRALHRPRTIARAGQICSCALLAARTRQRAP